MFVVAVWPGEAYEIVFYRESSKRDSSKNKKSNDHETAWKARFENYPKCNLALVTYNSTILKPLMMTFRCATFWWSGILRSFCKSDFLKKMKIGNCVLEDINNRWSKEMRNCPGAWSGHFKIISGSSGAHLKQNFEISPLGHLPDPKIQQTKWKIKKNDFRLYVLPQTPDRPPQRLLCYIPFGPHEPSIRCHQD